jgi:hypothetical protein
MLENLKKMDQALKALQAARGLNNLQPLDGDVCKGCNGIGDYAELYERLMRGQCQGGGTGSGAGTGMRGPGRGVGGVAPEDDSLVSSFKTELSRSNVQAGKMLLKMRTRGLGTPGEVEEDYREYLDKIKDGVGEAILHEQVPPAYHQAVKRYFDSIGEKDGSGED